MSAGLQDLERFRRELRRALLAAGVGERVIEAVERITIACLRRNARPCQRCSVQSLPGA